MQPNDDASTIRVAVPGDLSRIVDIYNYYVTHSHATFDVTPFTVGERVPWFAGFSETGPYRLLVAERDNQLNGWCCSIPFQDKPAYDISVETTVYVDPDAVGRGIGRALYTKLLEGLEAAGLHGAYAGIALPNDASVALHEHCGFRMIGKYEEVGRKFDRYWTVAWYGKRLQQDDVNGTHSNDDNHAGEENQEIA